MSTLMSTTNPKYIQKHKTYRTKLEQNTVTIAAPVVATLLSMPQYKLACHGGFRNFLK